MEETKLAEIMELKNKTLEEVKTKFLEVFGQEPTTNNKVFLWRKIAYRLQEIEHGELSAAGQGRIQELIKQFDPINNKTLRPEGEKAATNRKLTRDPRLPIPGTFLSREYKEKTHEVKVLEKGFEYQGKPFRSLTAIAEIITGTHINGYQFFNL